MRAGVAVAAVALALTAAAFAQDFGFRGGFYRGPFRLHPNVKYDGRFTFVRLKYSHLPGGNWYGGWPAWAHGYPIAEQNLMRIMNEVSYLSPHLDEINAITLDDPELFHYPIAYIIEINWWDMTDAEARGLREFMQKGGFVIVDDFKPNRRGFSAFNSRGDYIGENPWQVFESNMKKVLPDARFFDMDARHGVYHSFFEVNDLDIIPQAYVAGTPVFRGLFEDNDPGKRLRMIVNFNTDVSQFWEWSGTGLRPIDQTNEAYKLGVNYVIYGLTH
jgi:Domain of unknown function (DUF4159)